MFARSLLLALCVLGIAAPGARAEAVNANTVVRTMSCDNGATVTVQYERPATSNALPSTFRVVGSTATFSWQRLLLVSPNGEVIEDFSSALAGTSHHQQLVTCRFVSVATGNTFNLTGFFTPAY